MAFDELHHHVDQTVARRAQIIDGDGVRMTEAARGLAFTTKAAQPLRIVAHLRREDFDRHLIAEQDVARTIDRAHSAFADQRLDVILTVEDGINNVRRVVF